MLDKWAFKMSKIDGEESKPASFVDKESGKLKRADSTDLVADVSNVTLLEQNGIGEKATNMLVAPGPSLLSQQAPSPVMSSSTRPVPVPQAPQEPGVDAHASGSYMSVDRQSTTETSTSSFLEGNERITVKIADLGNGGWPFASNIDIFTD